MRPAGNVPAVRAFPKYPQGPAHPHFPGLDLDKGPVYRAAAMVIGAWIMAVATIVVISLASWSTGPLALLTWSPQWVVVPVLLAGTVMFRFVRDRMNHGVRPRRFGIQTLEATRQGTGPSTRKVVWNPHDRLPGLMRGWFALWCFDVGDGVIELILQQLGARRAPMVEEPPYYDAPMWPDDDGDDDGRGPSAPPPTEPSIGRF